MKTAQLINSSRSLLIIDDEIEITKALVRQFKRRYTVYSATNTDDAFQILEKEPIQVVISDQRMPGMTGVEFFTDIKTSYPDIIRLILTGNSDIDAVIGAINQGQVFRYITKPWHPDELDSIINEAFVKYELQVTNKQLINSLSEANINLEEKVSQRTQELELQNIELLEAEWKFKALFELGPIGVAYHKMIYDESGKPFDYYFIDANDSYQKLTGVNPKGMTVRQAFPGIENDPSDWIGMFGHVAKTGETIRFEQYLESNGRWYDCVGYQYEPDHFVAAFNEITIRKEAEKALKASEEKFKNFFENSVVGKSITSIDGKLNVNNTFCQIVGYSKEELAKMNWKQITHEDDIELNIEKINALLKGEKQSDRWEKRYIHKDGHIVWTDLYTTLQRDKDGNPQYYLTVLIDISERKKAEESLRQSEKEFRNLIVLSPVAMAIVHEWRTLYFNPAAVQLFGANSQHELLNKHIFDFVHPDYKALALENSKTLSEKGFVGRQEQKYLTLNGTVLDVETQSKSIRFNDKHATLVVINDITERKKLQVLLENERALYLDLVNTQPAGIYRIKVFSKEKWENNAWKNSENPPFKIELISERFGEILEISTDTFRTNPGIIIDLVHPDDKTEFVRRNEEANTLLITFSWDCRLLINNKIKWIHFESIPRKLDNGDILFTGIMYDITERKNSEKALIESEERYRNLLIHLETGIVVHAPDTSIVMCNPKAAQLLGLSQDQLTGKTAFDSAWIFLDDENKPYLPEEFPVVKIRNSKKSINNQIIGIQHSTNKDITWVTANGFPVLSAEGEITEIVISFNDITNRKLAENALLRNQKLLSDTEKTGKVGGWEFNMDTLEQTWTEETYEIHELPINYEASVEKGINFYTPESLPIIQNAVKLAIEKAEPYDLELEIITAKGNRKHVHTIGKTDIEGRRIYGFFQDITERKKAEIALKESEEKLSSLFNSMTEMVVLHELIFDDEGEAIDYIVTDCNKAFTLFVGIEYSEIIGKPATTLYATDTPPYLKEYVEVCASGKSIEFNTYFEPMDKYFLISVVASGKNRFSTITTDVTTHELINKVIKDKNKELENYIYVASHDLRSPLVNIQGFSQRLQKQANKIKNLVSGFEIQSDLASEIDKLTTLEIPKSVDFILNNVSKMENLINSLLQLSRSGQIKLNVNLLDMNNLLNKIISTYNFQLTELNAEVIVHDLIECYGDENQLNQLFSNIIGNAIKYSDKSKRLIIEISSKVHYNNVIYIIKDNGIGINQRHLDRIWDVFYRVDSTASQTGEGLGLSLAKRIAEKHLGKIWALSTEGVGSTFFVELHRNNFEKLN